MCGICGVVYADGRSAEKPLLQAMMGQIAHRGPDDEGIYAEPGVGLGFRRLSIIDLEDGHQPLSNEDGSIWIAFNGEIYNYKPLREMLVGRGHRFATHSDTEVIVHLYEEFGDACVEKLRGMFAFAIWDRRRRRLFGARDPFGIKPFYYCQEGGRVLFASEIKSLLAAGVRRSVQRESLLNYTTFQYVPEPLTMFEGIYKLPPGHTIAVAEDGRMQLRKYWEPRFEPDEGKPFSESVEEIREALKESVALHMQSDVPRGCFLSSGIDSTAIAALMKRIEPIKTFSVGFEGDRNETLIAAETAKALGTEHYAKVIGEQEYFDSLEACVWHQDEPVADPAAIALWHVAGLAREHVTVVLSGEGADELFGGYTIYHEPISLRGFELLPAGLKTLLRRLARLLPDRLPGRGFLLRGTTPLEQRFLGNANIFSEDMKAELLKVEPELLAAYLNPVQTAARFYRRTEHLDPITRMQHIDLSLWLPGDILMKADKMTMSHSLELRVPFLDRDVFEVARRIPSSHRIREGTTKAALRKAMEGIVPAPIVGRPKLGFPVPLKDWLRGPRGGQLLEHMQSCGIEDFVHMGYVRRMLERHQAGQGDYARKLWVVYMFALWHRAYMEAPQTSLNKGVMKIGE